MKKKIFIGIAIVIVFLVAASFLPSTTKTENADSTTSTLSVHETTETIAITEEETTKQKNVHSNLELFISNYNRLAKKPITNTLEIDIQSDEYYRTEFRLNAFQNAPALKGKIGDNSIELINSNYNGVFGSNLRIYAFVESSESVTDVFETFCKASNPEISESDFEDFYKYHKIEENCDIRIVIDSISGYIIYGNDGYDILLDSSPSYFENKETQMN